MLLRTIALVGLAGFGLVACGSSKDTAHGGGAGAAGIGGSGASSGASAAPAGGMGDSSGGTGGQATGSAGESVLGDAGAAGSDVNGIATLGGGCSQKNENACRGHAQKLRAVCDGSHWQSLPSCATGENCDTTSGLCAAIVDACAGRAAGDFVCSGSSSITCGVDLVSTSAEEACDYACDDSTGKCGGSCKPDATPTRCDGNTPQFCDTAGAWRDGPSGACPAATPVCFAGNCGECTPNDTPRRCVDNTPQYCNASGAWQAVTPDPCAEATGEVCDGGACTCPTGQVVCGAACVDTQTDASNCGGCGVACAGDCELGECLVVLASGLHVPTQLGFDATNVYFTEPNIGHVSKVPKLGGTVTPIVSSTLRTWGLVVNGDDVYWTNSDDPNGSIGNFSISGNVITGTPVTGLADPLAIAVDANQLYWVEASGAFRAPRSGGAAVQLGATGYPLSIAIDSTNAYWTDTYYGKVLSAPLNGGDPVTIASNQTRPAFVAADGVYVYWTLLGSTPDGSSLDGAVLRIGKNDTKPTILARGQAPPEGIAVDSGNAYWTTADGNVMKAGADGSLTTIATGLGSYLGDIAVDQTSVYWVDLDGVSKATPK